MATLQRALNAMGRALVLQVRKRPSSVDETLLREPLRATPAERLEAFERWYTDARDFALVARESRV